MLTLLLAQFAAVIQDTNSEAKSDLLKNLQRTLEYCIEENSALREVLELQNPGKRIRLSSEQKRRLAQKAINLKKDLLADVTDHYRPETILDWYRQLVGKKYDRHGGKKPVPVPISVEYIEMILNWKGDGGVKLKSNTALAKNILGSDRRIREVCWP